MSAREVNIPLLRKAVEWAEAEAAKPVELCRWEQGDWIATPEAQKDARRRVLRYGLGAVAPTTARLAAKATDCGTCYCIAGFVVHEVEARAPGASVVWSDVAQEALGITERQADRLFHACNTIEDVRRIAEEIAGERL